MTIFVLTDEQRSSLAAVFHELKAVGQFVVGAIRDISINIDHMVSQDALVADRITARGIRRDTGEPISWTENHFYRLSDGKISEWWPEGGPALG